jgi:hypothetical protein
MAMPMARIRRACSQSLLALLTMAWAAPSPPLASVSISASAPWVSDPAIEAASLVYETRGSAIAFWRAWSAQPHCSQPPMRCVLATLDAMELPPIERKALGVALAARIEAPTVVAHAQLSANVGGAADAACWPRSCGTVHASISDAVSALRAGCAGHDDDELPSYPGHEVVGVTASVDATRARLICYVDPHARELGAVLVASAIRTGGLATADLCRR